MVNIHEICKAKREYLPPESLDFQNYFDHLGAFNEAILTDAVELIDDMFTGVEDIAVCMTGSDSRLEKGPESELELMVLFPERGEKNDRLQDLKYLTQNCEGLEFDENIELKYVEESGLSKSTFTFQDGSEITLTSPDRMIDCCFLSGSTYLFNRARKKFVNELKDESGDKIVEKMKDRVRGHRKVTRRGVQSYKGADLTHFNTESGEVFYDPQKNLYGFKQGPLRAIQTSLVRDFIKSIRAMDSYGESARGIEQYFFTCKSQGHRQGVTSKLNYLRVRDMLEPDGKKINDLTDCYKYFLWGYHVSESYYHTRGVDVVSFDKKEMGERLEFVNDICKNQIVKY